MNQNTKAQILDASLDGAIRPADRHPVRNSNKPNRMSQHGLLPSRKNGFPQQVESRNERFFCLGLEIDPRVIRYQTQPIILKYREAGKKKVNRLIPDVEVWLLSGGHYFVEVKPTAQLSDPEVQKRLRVTKQLLAARGHEYKVVTEHTIYAEPVYSNILQLKRYFFWRVPERFFKEAANKIEKADRISLGELDDHLATIEPEFSYSFILALIAQGKILFNPSQMLTANTLLQLNNTGAGHAQ